MANINIITSKDGNYVIYGLTTGTLSILQDRNPPLHFSAAGFPENDYYNSAICILPNNAGIRMFIMFDQLPNREWKSSYYRNIAITLHSVGVVTVNCDEVNPYSPVESAAVPIFDNDADFFEFISNPLPQYSWQAVSSITGKDEIVLLSTISDVNNGDPVTTSDKSKFALSDSSSVNNLMSNATLNSYFGADGGGISGSGLNSGNQTTGYRFGEGQPEYTE